MLLDGLLSHSGYFDSRLLFVDLRHPLKSLHFVGGMAMSKGEPMVTANSDLALRTLLAGLLPTSPARLLLLGDCTDALVDELRARGYEVSNSAWCQPQGFAQFPSNTRQGIYQVDLALPHTETARFDAAVVCDVSPQVHPLALFEQLALCLVNDAVVVMLAKDEAGQSPPRVERWWDYLADIGWKSVV